MASLTKLKLDFETGFVSGFGSEYLNIWLVSIILKIRPQTNFNSPKTVTILTVVYRRITPSTLRVSNWHRFQYSRDFISVRVCIMNQMWSQDLTVTNFKLTILTVTQVKFCVIFLSVLFPKSNVLSSHENFDKRKSDGYRVINMSRFDAYFSVFWVITNREWPKRTFKEAISHLWVIQEFS